MPCIYAAAGGFWRAPAPFPALVQAPEHRLRPSEPWQQLLLKQRDPVPRTSPAPGEPVPQTAAQSQLQLAGWQLHVLQP
jgi:hypothetical protein